jgi:hypothetical protein
VTANTEILGSGTPRVFLTRHDLKVVRVHTSSIAAEVIEGHLRWDWSDEPRKHHSVRHGYIAAGSTSDASYAIPITSHFASPYPTARADHADNLLPVPTPFGPILHGWNERMTKNLAEHWQGGQMAARTLDRIKMHEVDCRMRKYGKRLSRSRGEG